MDEQTAYHEAGHVVMVLICGGKLVEATIEPNDDDGPAKYGQTISQWPRQSARKLTQTELNVSVAGPIAEAIWLQEVPEDANQWLRLFQSTAEWNSDWISAVESANRLMQHAGIHDENHMANLIAQSLLSTQRLFDQVGVWSAVADVADLLLAFETVEHEECMDKVGFWLRNF